MTDIQELISLIEILFPNLVFRLIRRDGTETTIKQWLLTDNHTNISVRFYRDTGYYMDLLHPVRDKYPVRDNQQLSRSIALVIENMKNKFYSCPEFKRECKDGFRTLTEADFPKKLV